MAPTPTGGWAHHTHKPRGARMAPGLPFNAGRWRSEPNTNEKRVCAAPPWVEPSVRVLYTCTTLCSFQFNLTPELSSDDALTRSATWRVVDAWPATSASNANST